MCKDQQFKLRHVMSAAVTTYFVRRSVSAGCMHICDASCDRYISENKTDIAGDREEEFVMQVTEASSSGGVMTNAMPATSVSDAFMRITTTGKSDAL